MEEFFRNHEHRIVSLEGRMQEVQLALARFEGELKLNNTMTLSIQETLKNMKGDTEVMVSLTKGLTIIGKMIAWLAGLGGLVGVIALATGKL